MATGKKPPRVEVRDVEPRKDMFYVYNADPEKYYHHVDDNPIRIREMQLKGFSVCTGDEVHLVDPMVIKDAADGTIVNLPNMVLMETSKDNKSRLDKEKDAKFARNEQDVKDKIDGVKAVIERSGLGGRVRAKIKDEEIEL